MDTLFHLKQVAELQDVPETQMQWLVKEGTCLRISTGDYLFKPGDPIDRMVIVMEGELLLKMQQNGQFRVVDRIQTHSITGYLPYSRASTAIGYGEAATDAWVFTLSKEKTLVMIRECHELTEALVHVMSSRIRSFTKQQQQNEKMQALGKLSAGIAHELNNPSAAIIRSSRSLEKHMQRLPDTFSRIIRLSISDDQVNTLRQALHTCVIAENKTYSLLEKNRLEDDMTAWLEDHGVDDENDLGISFVEFGLLPSDMQRIASCFNQEELPIVLAWMSQVINTERLVQEIGDAAVRINDLVTSVKEYTHMDQSPDMTAQDIHEGLHATLNMMQHKLRAAGVTTELQYADELPKPEIRAGQMNQVWTNLIDNAIDAMERSEKKVLTITTSYKTPYVEVTIMDTGTGIPDEQIDKIFDPFFTTKPVGKGTGLGLEIVQEIVRNAHQGQLSVTSKPGETTFRICIPLHANGATP